MRVIDLTHALTLEIPVFPGTPAPEFGTLADLGVHDFRESWFRLTSHMGTHCDAPAHLLPGGATLDSFSPEAWIGQGRRLDLRAVVRGNAGRIGPEHLRPLLPARCDWLLLWTGWERHWNRPDYFRGHPELTPAAAELLAGLGITGLGLDTGSPERGDDPELPVHRSLLRAGMLIVENLCNLSELPDSGFTFICAPLPLSSADGAPCRCLATIPNKIS
ncbi:MAG: cyclase family protein [Desulfovibrio sp.]